MENIENVKETGEVIKETSEAAKEVVEKAVHSGFNGWAVVTGSAITLVVIGTGIVIVKGTKSLLDKRKAKKEAGKEEPEVIDPKTEN